jgi:hypothetical protein
MMPQKITELWAWIGVEPDGSEGIVAKEMLIEGRRMFVPMVGADMARINSLRDEAISVGKHFGKPVKLVHFTITGVENV